MDLDAVYAGLGTEADFTGKDVKGKAVFVYSQLGTPEMGAVKRAAAKGAAVVFEGGRVHHRSHGKNLRVSQQLCG